MGTGQLTDLHSNIFSHNTYLDKKREEMFEICKSGVYGLRFAAEFTQRIDNRHPSYLVSGEIFILLEDLLRLIKRYPITIRFLTARIRPWYNNRILVGGTLSWLRTGVVGRMLTSPVSFDIEDAGLLRQFWQVWPEMNMKDKLALCLKCISIVFWCF